LINSNFLIKEFNDYDATQAIGVVIRQFPEAGATRTIGESVTITINKAP
jgi:serine/threonine-protein kinase